MSKESDLELVKRIDGEANAAFEALRQYHVAFDDNYRFWAKREHYSDEHANTRDRRRSKPKSRSLDSKITHKGWQVSKQTGQIHMRGRDKIEDPLLAEAAQEFMQGRVWATDLHWKRILKRAIRMAMGASAGAAALDIRYDLGPYPRVVPRLMDPRALSWTPGWQDHDDITCPAVYEDVWTTTDEVERCKWYKNNKDLAGEDPVTDASRPNPLQPISGTSGGPTQQAPTGEAPRFILLRKVWYRFDDSATPVAAGKPIELKPDQRYMACPTCDYTDKTQEGASLPDTTAMPGSAGFCPQCRAAGLEQPLGRVDHEQPTESQRLYAQGKRHIIIAPADQRILYDGPWLKSAIVPRGTPHLFLRCYDQGLEPWGQSDTERDWSYVTAENAMNRRAGESIARAGGIIITGGAGLKKNDGKTDYEFTDAPISLARWMGMGSPEIQFFQPRGMLNELMPYMSYLTSRFDANSGVFDAAAQLGPNRSKDIAVGTMQSLQSSGEIPADDMAEDANLSLGQFYGTWYDMARAVMTVAESIRVKGDPQTGIEDFVRMRGEDLPDMDVIVEGVPSWTQFDQQRIEAIATLRQEPDPEMRALMAEAANFPPSIVRRLNEIQMRQVAQGVVPGAPMNPNAAPPAATPQANGVAGTSPAR